MSEQKDMRSFPPVPMVYEQVAVAAQQWEYKVLTIEPREEELPGVDDLNELGNAGWLLVGSVGGNERQKVYYYFVRQKQA